MQTASFPAFFRTIIIIFGVYYALKFLARIFMPILMKKIVRKDQQNFEQHAQNINKNQQNTQQPDVSTNKNPKSKKQIGEYVDYEELD